MNWLMLSLMAAMAVATQDAWVKKRLSHLSAFEMSLYPLLYSLPLFLGAIPFISRPALDATFWWSFAACLPFECLAIVIYMKSIKVSPLSLSIPYLAFTPAFILVTGFVILDEIPNLAGVLGILTTVCGSYILNLNPGNRGILGPFRNIAVEKGSWLMIVVALLYSFTSVLAKNAIIHSSPIFFGIVYCITFNSIMVVGLYLIGKVTPRSLLEHPSLGFALGLLFFLQIIFNNLALSLTKVAYMISVKRFSIVFSVLYGGVLFKEEEPARRLAGASIMVSGAVIISLWGR